MNSSAAKMTKPAWSLAVLAMSLVSEDNRHKGMEVRLF